MADIGPTPEDYGRAYFASFAGGEYHSEAGNWQEFFVEVASRLVELFSPASVLDAGCAKGLLVAALVDAGADARGIDVSDHAIAEAPDGIRDRLSVGSLADPIAGRFDLVTCIEVLEHMNRGETSAAMDHLCAVSDRIVFSSTPADFAEPTHVNVRPPAEWAAEFAERGFFRRTDVDLAYLSPWAVVYERRRMTVRDSGVGWK